MSTSLAPILIYPNGGEEIFAAETIIQWEHSSLVDTSAISYEIYYAEQFDPLKEPDWKQLAVLPGTASQYVWIHGSGFRTSNCRVAIRTRSGTGERSPFVVSANNFSIHRHKLLAPIVISPVSSGRYDKFISILTDDSGLSDSDSSRSFYQFYYSSVKLSQAKTAIAQNVSPGDSIVWNTFELPSSDDYVLYAYLSDDAGNTSDVTVIKNIQINHEGFFLIDTIPPVAGVVINNHAIFTRERDVEVKVVSYDKTTSVHSIQLVEGDNEGTPDLPSEVKYFTLSDGDAIKTVELVAQDFGANRIGGDSQRTFEVMVDEESEIIDLSIDPLGYVWFITSGNVNSLYKANDFAALMLTLEDHPTAIEIFGSFVYITTKTTSDKGVLNVYDGSDLSVIKSFTESDSIINSTVVYNDKLYLGAENGMVYEFDGLNFRTLTGTGNPVSLLTSDGNLLYLTEKNGSDVYIFNGTSFININ